MEDYFTPEEITKINNSFELVTKAGLHIKRRHQDNEQENIFFDKAKLWRVIQKTIEALFIERICSGELYLTDQSGTKYITIPVEVKDEEDRS